MLISGFSIGKIIGTGIFSTPSSITTSVGSVGAAMMLWLLGLFLSFSGLCVWLELGCMFPRSGGEKVYLEAAYPRPRFLATIVFASQAVLLGFTGMSFTPSPFYHKWRKKYSICDLLVSGRLIETQRILYL